MAIAVDNTSNGTDSGSVELTVAHTVTSIAGGGILVVTVQVTDSAEDEREISTVTHNGEDCTYWPGADADDTIEQRTEIWYRVNPTTGGTPNIVVTPVGSCTDLSLGAVSLDGVSTDNVDALVDSYAWQNAGIGNYPLGNASSIGQSFTATVSATNNKLGYMGFRYVSQLGTTPGNIVAKLYSHTGTYGTSSIPDALIATSDNVAVSSFENDPATVWFTFSGAEQVTLTNGTKYCAVLEYNDGDINNYLRFAYDVAGGTHSGNFFTYISSWVSVSASDFGFYVNTAGGISQSAIGDSTPPTLSITTEGTSSYVIDSLAIAESEGTKITAVHTAGDSPIHKTDVGGDTHGSQYVDAGDTGPQTMNWNDTDQDKSWALSAVAVSIAADDAVRRIFITHV